MKIHSYGKKLMAVACAVVMLVSCMVFAPVSAAINAKGTWDCEAPENSAWNNAGGNNNVVRDGASMTLETVTEGAAHSGIGVVVAKFTDNWSGANDTEQSVPACRLMIGDSDSNNSQKVINGRYYRVKFWYKIVNLPVDAELRFAIASRPWGNKGYNSVSNYYDAATLKTTDEVGVWKQADVVFWAGSTNGLHIFLKSTDDTQRVGTEVWLDDFEYYQVDSSDAVYLTLDANGGTVKDKYTYAIKGENAPVTVTATRGEGYTFAGWYSSKESADNLVEADKVTVFPDNTATTVYAGWIAPAASWYTVTLHANPGTLTGEATVRCEEGTPITTTDPVRPGWEFTGWYTEAGDAGEKITAVAGDMDAYAHWTKIGTVEAVANTWNFEDAAVENITYNEKKPAIEISTEENHTFAGEKSLKVPVRAGGSGGTARPRIVLQDENGKNIVVQEGKSYEVTFWVKSSRDNSDFRYYLATTASLDDVRTEGTAYTMQKSLVHNVGKCTAKGSDAAQADCIEVAVIHTNDSTWTKISCIIPEVQLQTAGVDNYLQLALTNSMAFNAGFSIDYYVDDVTVREVTGQNFESIKNDGNTKNNNATIKAYSSSVQFSTAYNHTPNGDTSIKLSSNKGASTYNTDRIAYAVDYNNVQKFATNQKYFASVWLYTETAITNAKVRFINDGDYDTTGLGWFSNKAAETKLNLPAGEWTNVRFAFTFPGGDSNNTKYQEAYLSFGVSSDDVAATVYVDDLQIVAVPDDSYGYDDLAVTDKIGSSSDKTVFGTGTARGIANDVPDHTYGDTTLGRTLKINLHDGDMKRVYAGINKPSGGAKVVEEGHTYRVSAWLYAKEDMDLTAYMRAATGVSVVHLDKRIEAKSDGTGSWSDAAVTLTTGQAVSLKAGQWQQVSYLVTVPVCNHYTYNAETGKEGTADDGVSTRMTYKYLALGLDAKTVDTYIYMDDVSVEELTDTLDSFAGNAALYSKGNDTAYSDGYGAMRFLGGYQTVDGDATKAVIGGVTYTVKQRGIILGSETQTGLTLTSESLKVSTATKGLENYWEMRNGSFVTFSLLIKNVAAAKTTTKYNFRPYVTVEVNGADVTLYGKEVNNITWDDVFAKALKKNPDLDKSWTNSAE